MYHNPRGMERSRNAMVQSLMNRGIYSNPLLKVMQSIPRHLFVSEALRYRSYEESSLPIGFGQTISKPFVIASMVQALHLTGDEKVLEIGTGSGYQTAILSLLSGEVVSLERIGELYHRARNLLLNFDLKNYKLMHEEDFTKMNESYDAIIVAAGASILPQELLTKLNPRGRLIIPVEEGSVHSIRKYYKRDDGSCLVEEIGEAIFVPLIRDGNKSPAAV